MVFFSNFSSFFFNSETIFFVVLFSRMWMCLAMCFILKWQIDTKPSKPNEISRNEIVKMEWDKKRRNFFMQYFTSVPYGLICQIKKIRKLKTKMGPSTMLTTTTMDDHHSVQWKMERRTFPSSFFLTWKHTFERCTKYNNIFSYAHINR